MRGMWEWLVNQAISTTEAIGAVLDGVLIDNFRILDYRRAIAYHRPQTWANDESDLTLEDVREFVNLALFYGIFPHRKDEAANWEEGSDQLITDTQHPVLGRRLGAGNPRLDR